MIRKLTDRPESLFRRWYNQKLSTAFPRHLKTLDIGKSMLWDYSGMWLDYTTIDIIADHNPTIVGDITTAQLPRHGYDLILCNGMYEYVADIPAMVRAIHFALKPGGSAVFGFAGRGYPHVARDNFSGVSHRFSGNFDVLQGFEVIEEVRFGDEYHFAICLKAKMESLETAK